jgi:hypothetical protein
MIDYRSIGFDLLVGRPNVRGDGLCGCGCGERTTVAPCSNAGVRWVKGAPVHFLRNHHRRIRSYVSAPTANGCILWTAGTDGNGYGKFKVRLLADDRPTYRLAHRLVFEQRVREIPEGMELDHLCRVHGCVNPSHLDVVTHAENGRRGLNATLTHASVQEIRCLLDSTTAPMYHEIGESFGVSASAIRGIAIGKNWKADEPTAQRGDG